MLGKNPVRHEERHPEDKLQVNDVWYTLQGEGPYAGRPAIFIRLTGCNLRCTFCDTEWDDANDPYISVAEVVLRVMSVGNAELVVITGGEPLRQPMNFLIPALLKIPGVLHIQFETAGTLWQDCLMSHIQSGRVSLVVSPKTPKINNMVWKHAFAFKYVINEGQTDEKDGLPIVSTQDPTMDARLQRPRPGARVYLSPCDDANSHYKTLENQREVARLSMQFGYTAGVQLHKIWNVK